MNPMIPTLSEAITRYLDYLPTRNYSLLSIKTARSKLGLLATFTADVWPDESLLIDWQIQRAARVTKTTMYHDTTTIRVFFAWCVRMKLIHLNPSVNIQVPKRPKKLPRPLDDATIHTLLNGWEPQYATRDHHLAARDRALVRTYMLTGLRRAELCALDVGDIDLSARMLSVRSGKGDRDRMVAIPERLDLGKIINKRQLNAPLFVGKTGKRLDPNAISYIFTRKVSSALGVRVTPHMLRHSYATYLCRHGVSVRQIQELLGHSSLATTQIYLQVSGQDLARAVSVLDQL